MTTTRLLPSHGVLAKIALPLLVGLLLVGCNDSDPYNSGQNVSGTILEPSTVNPLDPNSPATQVGLFVNAPISGVSYTCDDSNKTTSISGFLSQSSSSSDSSNGNVPVARCGNDAYSVTFFLGLKDASNFSHHLDIGTIHLPLQTASGADGKVRFDVNKNDISSSSFFYPFSTADMFQSPARVQADMSTATGRELVFKTALLMALNTSTTPNQLVLAKGANEVAAYPGQNGLSALPSGFNYSTYADFQAAWTPYLNAVSHYQANHKDQDNSPDPLPPIVGWPAEVDVLDSIGQGESRLNTGGFSVDYSNQTFSYYLAYKNCIFQKLAELSVNFMVYPDSTVTGFGVVQSNSDFVTGADGTCTSLSGNSVKGDYAFVGPDVATGLSYGQMDALQTLKNVQVQSVGTTDGGASVNVLGRFLGDFLYDGRVPPSSSISNSDYNLDYPKTNYVMTDVDKGSLTGQAFDIDLPSYSGGGDLSGVVSVRSSDNLPLPMPVRLSKSARGQSIPLDVSLLSQLPDFYRIRLMRFCGPDEPGCSASIPNLSVETGAGGNYLSKYCVKYQEDANGKVTVDSDGNPICQTEITVSKEMPRLNQYGGSTGDIYLKFDKSRKDKGIVILELADSSCNVLLNGKGDPYYLGFVSATQPASGNLPDTVSVNMLFTGSDRASLASKTIPQLGVSLSGRIDLSQITMPMYRLSDNNFEDGLRARWADTYRSRLYDAFQSSDFPKDSNGAPDFESFTSQQIEFYSSLYWASGAVDGHGLNSSCQPL